MRLLILAIALTTTSMLAAPPPSITLALLPPATLPGLPVSFLLTITNPSDQPVRFSDQSTLSATTAAGTFEVHGLSGTNAAHLPKDQMEKCNAEYCFTVAAHGSRQLYYDAGPALVGNEFFGDRQLCVPGQYTLEMTLYFDGPNRTLIPVHTNNSTLTVAQPTGVDASAWQALLDASGGNGWGTFEWAGNGERAAPALRNEFPSSTYSVWSSALGRVISLTSTIAQFDRALATNPPPSVRDELLLAKGGVLAGWSDHAVFSERDADKAVTLAEQARAVFNLLRDVAVTDYTRSRATNATSHLLTRAGALDDLRLFAENDAPAPAAIVPRVECVTKGSGQSFSAWFGYSNPNRVIKVLQIGSDNQVTPAPRDQGQPRMFKPGDRANVFVATSPGGNLKWHLDGNTATATADFPTTCTP